MLSAILFLSCIYITALASIVIPTKAISLLYVLYLRMAKRWLTEEEIYEIREELQFLSSTDSQVHAKAAYKIHILLFRLGGVGMLVIAVFATMLFVFK